MKRAGWAQGHLFAGTFSISFFREDFSEKTYFLPFPPFLHVAAIFCIGYSTIAVPL